MRHFHKQKNHYHCPIINLDKLWTLVGEEKRLECAAASGKAPVIDLTDYGIFKCLGKGQLPKQPVVVKARYISRLAVPASSPRECDELATTRVAARALGRGRSSCN